MEEYKYLVGHDGDCIRLCDACWAEVPLHAYRGRYVDYMKTKSNKRVYMLRTLCELCASSVSGNAEQHPNGYAGADAIFASMFAANAILKHLGKFDNAPRVDWDECEYITEDGEHVRSEDLISSDD